MVSNKFLSALSVKLGFHKCLRAHSTAIINANTEYVAELEECERQSQGSPDYWTLAKNPPKVSLLSRHFISVYAKDRRKALSDIVESYIGAIFVDSEFDFKQVERFFDDHIRWFFEDMSIYDSFANNHPVVSFSRYPSPTKPTKPTKPTPCPDSPQQPPHPLLRLHQLPHPRQRNPLHRRLPPRGR